MCEANRDGIEDTSASFVAKMCNHAVLKGVSMTSRNKVTLPLLAAILLVVFYALFRSGISNSSAMLLLGLAAFCIVVSVALMERLVWRPLTKLHQRTQSLAATSSSVDGQPIDIVISLNAVFTELGTNLRDHHEKLAAAVQQRDALTLALREAEDRFTLATERANDGIWEWDIKNNDLNCSPRWKGMLGYSENAPTNIDHWKKLVHPDDTEAVFMRLQNHLESLTQYFNAEYRLRSGEGVYRWVHSRGTTLRHAGGKAYRMLVMDQDTHEKRQLEEALTRAAEGLSAVSGEEFFRALVKNLCAVMNARDGLACFCIGDPPTRARTLAFYSNGQFRESIEYDLKDTSCGAVIDRKEIVYCPTGVCDIWPFEKKYDRDSYLGVPLFDSTGKIIGHFACADAKPMQQDLPHLSIFKIFSVRASAELERTMLNQRLQSMHGLEHNQE